MVKRTNRIQNLNKMIQDYKREQEKFEVIEQEIFNQQKEIEDLRLLILSTNFLNHSNSSIKRPDQSDTSTEISSKLNLRSIKEQNIKNAIKNPTKDKMNLKVKELQDKNANLLKTKDNQLNDPSGKKADVKYNLIDKQSEDREHQFNRTPNQMIKSKGLQTISKNVLNQKDTKYSTHKNDKSSCSNLLNDLKIKSEILKNRKNLKLDESKVSKSTELLNNLNKLKPVSNKFENQENPKERFGLNKISKSIKKVSRSTVKSSALKSSSTKLTNSNSNSNHQINQLTLQRL